MRCRQKIHPTTKTPKTKTPKDKDAPLAPLTPKDIATSMMNQMLKEGASARATCVAITGLEYSDNLAGQMKEFADEMEEKFKAIQSKVFENKNSKEDYPELAGLQKRLDWYAEKKAFARSVERRATTQANPGKGKGKAKGKAAPKRGA